MRDVNIPEIENPAHTYVRQLLGTPGGRQKICDSVISQIRWRVKCQSPWFGILFEHGQVDDPQHTFTVNTNAGFSVQRPDLVERAQGFTSANLVTLAHPEIQTWMQTRIESEQVPLTQAAWDEARAGYCWAVMTPGAFSLLKAQPWWAPRWNPTTRIELTRVGHFGAYGGDEDADPLMIRATRDMRWGDAVFFSRGQVGKMQTEVSVTPGPQDSDSNVEWAIRMTVKMSLHDPPPCCVRLFRAEE